MKVLAKKIFDKSVDSNVVIIKDIPSESYNEIKHEVLKLFNDNSINIGVLDFKEILEKKLIDVEDSLIEHQHIFLDNFFLEHVNFKSEKIVFVNFLLMNISKNHKGIQKQLVFMSPGAEKTHDKLGELFEDATGMDAKAHPYLNWGHIYSMKEYGKK